MSFGKFSIATALGNCLQPALPPTPRSLLPKQPVIPRPEILPPSAPGPITRQGFWLPRVEAGPRRQPALHRARPVTALSITGDKPMRERGGIASWYGKQFHGRRHQMAEVFDMYSSPQPQTMELPGYARVTNLENGRSMIIRSINDREGRSAGTELLTSPTERQSVPGMLSRTAGRSGADHDGGNRGRHLEPHGYCFEHYPGDAETAGTENAISGSPATARACSGRCRSGLSRVLTMPRLVRPYRSDAVTASGGRTATTRIVQSSDSLYRVLVGANLTHERATAEAHRIAGIIGGPAFATQR